MGPVHATGRSLARMVSVSRQMNPRQRQGLLLVVIAAVGLIGVFLLIASYVSSISKQVGPKVGLVELAQPLSPYQPVTPGSLQVVSLPAKWAPPNALRDPSQALGLVSSVALPQGTVVEQGMLNPAPALQRGQREIAILIDGESGVAGQVVPGSMVDVVGTFKGNSLGSRSSARVIVAGARVLGVGVPTANAGPPVLSAAKSTSATSVVPITFAFTPEQVLAVSYAESFADRVRLSLVAPGSTGPPGNLQPYSPLP